MCLMGNQQSDWELGSFDKVAGSDSRRVACHVLKMSATGQQKLSPIRTKHAPSSESSFRVSIRLTFFVNPLPISILLHSACVALPIVKVTRLGSGETARAWEVNFKFNGRQAIELRHLIARWLTSTCLIAIVS